MKRVTRDLTTVEPADTPTDERKSLLSGVSALFVSVGVAHFGLELAEDQACDNYISACESSGISGAYANMTDRPHLCQSLGLQCAPAVVLLDENAIPSSVMLGVTTKAQMEAFLSTGVSPL